MRVAWVCLYEYYLDRNGRAYILYDSHKARIFLCVEGGICRPRETLPSLVCSCTKQFGLICKNGKEMIKKPTRILNLFAFITTKTCLIQVFNVWLCQYAFIRALAQMCSFASFTDSATIVLR